MPPKELKEINEFSIKKVDNGYTLYIRYAEEKSPWGALNLVAKDLHEVHDFVDMWFSKIQ